MMRLLVVDDDLATCAAIKSHFRNDFEVMALYDGDGLEAETRRFMPDLILLDINMPGRNGLELLRDLGELVGAVPVFMISVRGGEEDIVRAFELGASDYITKPFSLAVLQARLQRWLGKKSAPTRLKLENFEIDLHSGQVIGAGVSASLTRKELLTLRYLLANEGQVLSRQQILGFAWGYDYDGTPRTVDNTIASLRRKLPVVGADEIFCSHSGLGYSLKLP
ncbi:MAG: response regulator transcription factor [Candidatus Rifleibacteriota bacterium]